MKDIGTVRVTSVNAVSDLVLEDWYNGVLTSTVEVLVSTDNMVNRLRLGLLKKELAPFTLDCNGVLVQFNEHGMSSDWNSYPFTQSSEIVEQILLSRINK